MYSFDPEKVCESFDLENLAASVILLLRALSG
jgi:hypothetical protein